MRFHTAHPEMSPCHAKEVTGSIGSLGHLFEQPCLGTRRKVDSEIGNRSRDPRFPLHFGHIYFCMALRLRDTKIREKNPRIGRGTGWPGGKLVVAGLF